MLEPAHTIEELGVALATSLKGGGLASVYADEFALALASEFATFQPGQVRPGTFGLLVGRYAIRKDDLKLFEALTDGLKAAAGVSFFTSHQPVLSANVGIGVSLARLLRNLGMRGSFLDEGHLHVLTILHCNVVRPHDTGLLVSEILSIVARTRTAVDLLWVQQRLLFLKDVPTRDGSSAKLASDDALGHWRPHV